MPTPDCLAAALSMSFNITVLFWAVTERGFRNYANPSHLLSKIIPLWNSHPAHKARTATPAATARPAKLPATLAAPLALAVADAVAEAAPDVAALADLVALVKSEDGTVMLLVGLMMELLAGMPPVEATAGKVGTIVGVVVVLLTDDVVAVAEAQVELAEPYAEEWALVEWDHSVDQPCEAEPQTDDQEEEAAPGL